MFACEDGTRPPAPDYRRLHLSDAVTTIAAYARMSAEMDGPSPELTPQPARTPDDRLDSWKEIAAYLKRDVTTVRRWEKREGMPVHRHVHDKLGSGGGVSVRARRLDSAAAVHSPLPTTSIQSYRRIGATLPRSW